MSALFVSKLAKTDVTAEGAEDRLGAKIPSQCFVAPCPGKLTPFELLKACLSVLCGFPGWVVKRGKRSKRSIPPEVPGVASLCYTVAVLGNANRRFDQETEGSERFNNERV